MNLLNYNLRSIGRLKDALRKHLGDFSQCVLIARYLRYAPPRHPMTLSGWIRLSTRDVRISCSALSAGFLLKRWEISDIIISDDRSCISTSLVTDVVGSSGIEIPVLKKGRNTRRWTFCNLWVESPEIQIEWHLPAPFFYSPDDIRISQFIQAMESMT